MESRDYIILLYDFYMELFNDKQKEYFEDYYFNNLSLAEISDNIGVSRNAVHKILKNVENKLLFYEDRLQLYKKRKLLLDIIDNLDDNVKDKIKELI